MSDVPLGVFLSGGVDSSAVAALMTKIRRTPVETFSVGYAEDAYSELPFARVVAKHLNSLHHEVLVSQQDFFDSLPHLIWHEDEPIVWPSSVPLYFVAKLAQERVKVVLTGEGADETLAGYTRYAFTLKNAAWDRLYRRMIPGTVRASIRGSISDSTWINASIRRKLSHTFLARNGSSWASFYFDNFFSAFSENDQGGLLSSKVVEECTAGAAYHNVLEYWDQSSGEMLHRLLYTDIKTYLVELLMKQDNMSMAASIESRVPFLDHKLVEFAARIPRRVQIAGLTGKKILKTAMRDLLPHSIVYRQKLGFPDPVERMAAWAAVGDYSRSSVGTPESGARTVQAGKSGAVVPGAPGRVSRPWRSHLAVVESGAVAARLPGRRLSRGRVARTGRSRVSFDLMMDTAIPQAF